jgi:hypothetical protein
LIVCSSASNSFVLKNSPNVIPTPSHIILIVSILGFLLLPYKIFFTDEGGSADKFASLFMLILRSSHSCSIRLRIAVTVSIQSPPSEA